MKDYIALLGLVKSKVDNGFSQAGKQLRALDPVDRALMLVASRSIAAGNALMVLAQNNHANEALPLLRALWELSTRAQWIVQRESGERAKKFLAESESAGWARFYAEETPEASAWLKEYVHANAAGLPWGHIFSDHHAKGVTPEQLLAKAVEAQARMLESLDAMWPGKFAGAKEITSKLKDAGSRGS